MSGPPQEQERPNHMEGAEFRRTAEQLMDWIVGYQERLEEFPVLSEVEPGWVRAQLPDEAPEQGEDFQAVLDDLERIILPGLTHWQAPGFFGYFSANASAPAALADLLSSSLGVVGMLWLTSPACTELEQHVLDWLVTALGLPEKFRGNGVIQDTASSSTLCAILAARQRAGGTEAIGSLRAYVSQETHSSVEKGLRVAGIGDTQVRKIATTPDFAMRADHLAYEIVQDRNDGFTPFFVCATVGTTSSTALDPVAELGWVAQNFEAWLHVDAAYAGSAAICPELRFLHDGMETADSYVFNPHKWLLTNLDCSVLYVAEPDHLMNALSITPEYLRTEVSEAGQVVDYRDWAVPLGRRFRALKLWFVMRHYGLDGLRAHIRRHVAWAAELAEWVQGHDRFELAAPQVLGLVCLRHVDGDAASRRVLEAANQSGRFHLTHTELDGSYMIRVALGSPNTERRHVQALWEQICESA